MSVQGKLTSAIIVGVGAIGFGAAFHMTALLGIGIGYAGAACLVLAWMGIRKHG